jgi:hypothetical protein
VASVILVLMTARAAHRFVLFCFVLTSAACGASAAPAPESEATATESGATVARTELSDEEMARLRASVPQLVAGMTRDEVFAALGVSLDGLPQLGTGPQQETTTIYGVGRSSQLNLTWNALDLEHIVLVRAELLEPTS